LQEADTTSEWDASIVKKFLALRTVPGTPVSSPAIKKQPLTRAVNTAKTAPASPDTAKILSVTQDFADGLGEGDVTSHFILENQKRRSRRV
jgi:hypothetical protein